MSLLANKYGSFVNKIKYKKKKKFGIFISINLSNNNDFKDQQNYGFHKLSSFYELCWDVICFVYPKHYNLYVKINFPMEHLLLVLKESVLQPKIIKEISHYLLTKISHMSFFHEYEYSNN